MTLRRRGAGAIALLALTAARLADVQAASCEAPSGPAMARQAEQKIVLLERLIGGTEPVQRVLSSNNADAERALAGAQSAASRATAALDAGCPADAIEHASTGLGLASQAMRTSSACTGRSSAQRNLL